VGKVSISPLQGCVSGIVCHPPFPSECAPPLTSNPPRRLPLPSGGDPGHCGGLDHKVGRAGSGGANLPCSMRDSTKIENVLDWGQVVKKYYAVVRNNEG
jgi:hypothetical protein